MAAIVVQDLRKSYGKTKAVQGVSFTVEEGQCVALLGPNGAGKTTTLEVLEGYLQRDSGQVDVLGDVGGGKDDGDLVVGPGRADEAAAGQDGVRGHDGQ